jgi:hypothetical protein
MSSHLLTQSQLTSRQRNFMLFIAELAVLHIHTSMCVGLRVYAYIYIYIYIYVCVCVCVSVVASVLCLT